MTPAGANANALSCNGVCSFVPGCGPGYRVPGGRCVRIKRIGRPGYFSRTRLWFNSRMLLCHGSDPGAIPGSRTNLHVATYPHPLRRWLDKQGAGLQNQIMQARYLPAVRGVAMCLIYKWDRGSTRKAPALQAGSCGGVTRRFHHLLSLRRGRRGRLGGFISRFKRVRFPFPQPFSLVTIPSGQTRCSQCV